MHLAAVRILQPLGACAQRDEPVGADLEVLVAGLQGVVVEGVVLGVLALGGPDHRLVRVGEAAAAEIGHRVGLAPHDVVEDPEAQILQDRSDPENIVVGADDPERGVGLHHAARGQQPGAGEMVVIGEAGELVPVVVDGIDQRMVRPCQRIFELKIVGGVREHQVHTGIRVASPTPRRSRRAGSGRGEELNAPSEQPVWNARYARP